jgi:hypothetical protein
LSEQRQGQCYKEQGDNWFHSYGNAWLFHLLPFYGGSFKKVPC